MLARDYRAAEAILRSILTREPDSAVALRMLGEIAGTFGAYRDAERLHRRALEIAPDFEYARLHLAITLHDQQRNGESLAQLQCLTSDLKDAPETQELLASLLWRVGEYDRARELLTRIIELEPGNDAARITLAHVLKTIGRAEEAIAVCREGLVSDPFQGNLWWTLADMKSLNFSGGDVDAMSQALESGVDAESSAALHFSLGKAFADQDDRDASWGHYETGNRIKADLVPYDGANIAGLIDRTERLFTPEFLERRTGGDPRSDPIFVVGLPRSGSTLVEQILASHSLVEGTAELPDIDILARSLESDPRWEAPWRDYPDRLAGLSSHQAQELGALYLERTRIQRKTHRPYFVDKMPDNWLHVGFIKLILPNATIIDVRRHPVACGYSNFAQLYARGHAFSYDLGRFAEHYGLYVRAMNYFEQTMPGMVYRIIYEELVAKPEQEIRRLLQFTGLPFEDACLRPHETRRAVRTASAEQVRQSIGALGSGEWRKYRDYLGMLEKVFGPLLTDWEHS